MEGGDYLLEDDREFLDRKGWDYEVHPVQHQPGSGSQGELQIVIRGYPMPARYSPGEVDMLVRQLPGYPEVGMDMFWTRPDVVMAGSSQMPQATDVKETYLDLQWQRWSRHMNGWRPGTDNLETFFGAIKKELDR